MPVATEKVYIVYDEKFPVFEISTQSWGIYSEVCEELDSATLAHIVKTLNEYDKIQKLLSSIYKNKALDVKGIKDA